jgi:hypothetical protein
VPEALDDQTVAYVLATRPHFENLRDAAAQLAGLLVLAASGARSAEPGHPLLRSAATRLTESRDGIRSTPGTERARRHHWHLQQAAEALEAAAAAAQEQLGRPASGSLDDGLDAILAPLRGGYAHLEHAAHALPGFELVSFAHACCGSGMAAATSHTMEGSR